jgi:fatty-acyl-CoA synthase
MFACAMLSAVFVPINFRLVAREVGLQFDACTPKILLAGEGFADLLDMINGRPSFPQRVVWIDDQLPAGPEAEGRHSYDSWLAQHDARAPDIVVPADSILMLLHSSGTTGLPKGIIFTHATAHASCTAKIIDFTLIPEDTTVVFGPLHHAGPLMDLALPLLLRGGRVVIGPSRQFDPARLLATVAVERGTVIPIYPTMLRRVLAAPELAAVDLSSLRLVITGGEAAPLKMIQEFNRLLPTVGLVNNYGSTEGGPITTFLSPEESRRKIGSVGKEAFGVEVRIADDDGRPLPAGQVGHLLVRSPFVCGGYWNQADLTAASQRNGWWHTGDLASRDADGYLWIAGRSKDIIKSGAMNIFPIEVEQVIAGIDGVVEVGVVGVPDDEWGEAVAAFVVTSPGATLAAEQVVEECRRQLASYKKPRHVVFVESLPRGTTNKVAKNVLRAQWLARQGGA